MYEEYKKSEKRNQQNGHVSTITGMSAEASRPEIAVVANLETDACIAGDSVAIQETVCELSQGPGDEEDASITVVVSESSRGNVELQHDEAEEIHSEPINVEEEAAKASYDHDGDHPEAKDADKTPHRSDYGDSENEESNLEVQETPETDQSEKLQSESEAKKTSLDDAVKSSVDDSDVRHGDEGEEQNIQENVEAKDHSEHVDDEVEKSSEIPEVAAESSSADEIDKSSISANAEDELTPDGNDVKEKGDVPSEISGEVTQEKEDAAIDNAEVACSTVDESKDNNDAATNLQAENSSNSVAPDDNVNQNVIQEYSQDDAETSAEVKTKPDPSLDKVSAEVGDHLTSDDKNHVVPSKPEDNEVGLLFRVFLF